MKRSSAPAPLHPWGSCLGRQERSEFWLEAAHSLWNHLLLRVHCLIMSWNTRSISQELKLTAPTRYFRCLIWTLWFRVGPSFRVGKTCHVGGLGGSAWGWKTCPFIFLSEMSFVSHSYLVRNATYIFLWYFRRSQSWDSRAIWDVNMCLLPSRVYIKRTKLPLLTFL